MPLSRECRTRKVSIVLLCAAELAVLAFAFAALLQATLERALMRPTTAVRARPRFH